MCAKARQARQLGSSWDLVSPGHWPHLVGRHQVEVARVCGVELHDVVHGLPIGHRHCPPADHLHALVQVDLWREVVRVLGGARSRGAVTWRGGG